MVDAFASGELRLLGEEQDFAADRAKACGEEAADGRCIAWSGLGEEQLVCSCESTGLGQCLSGDTLIAAMRRDFDRDLEAIREAVTEDHDGGTGWVCEDPNVLAVGLGSVDAPVLLGSDLAKG